MPPTERETMGHVYVDAKVTATRTQVVRFLVDTGASYTLLPQSIAEAVGMVALPVPVRAGLANGGEVAYPVGACVLDLLDRQAPATAFIVPDAPGLEPLLGVEALEGLGLQVDSTSQTLQPTRARAVLLVGLRTPR
jgi:predicted aspartyl protease